MESVSIDFKPELHSIYQTQAKSTIVNEYVPGI